MQSEGEAFDTGGPLTMPKLRRAEEVMSVILMAFVLGYVLGGVKS